MAWYWPPSWFQKPRPLPPAPTHGHREIAAEFFFLPRKEQLQVLYFLGVGWTEQPIILASVYVHNDVKAVMEVMEDPKKKMTADIYLDRLKAIHLDGRGYHVEAAFHNIFRDMEEAKYYSDKVLKWGS